MEQDNFDTEEEDDLPRWSLSRVLLTFLFLFLFPLVMWVFGECRFGWGARAFREPVVFRALFSLLFWVAVLHGFLTWPLSEHVLKKLSKWPLALRSLLGSLLISGPVMSYLYYASQATRWEHYLEIGLTVWPVAFLAVYFYEQSKRLTVLTLYFGLGVWVSAYVMNDILSPFNVLVSYIPRDLKFLYVRILFPILSICLAILPLPKNLRSGFNQHLTAH